MFAVTRFRAHVLRIVLSGVLTWVVVAAVAFSLVPADFRTVMFSLVTMIAVGVSGALTIIAFYSESEKSVQTRTS